ncbi:MAG: hypothetical protein ACRC13_10500 [Tannerellaceae bacterium]
MKKMIFAALLAGCIGCSNQEDVLLDKEGKVSLSVNLSFSDVKTKSNDPSIAEPYPKWSQLLLIAKDNTGAIIEQKLVNNEDPFNNTINLIEKSDNNKLIGGTVVAYAVTEGHDWGTISTSNLPVLADFTKSDSQKDINNWQPSGFIKDQIKGNFVNVPYYGSSNITLNGNAVDGHIKLSATVNVIPELGRIQVLKTPNKGGVKDLGNGNKIVVSAIKVTDVYINRLKSSSGDTLDIRNKKDLPETGWASEYYGSGKSLWGMTDNFTNSSNPTNVGYQIFEGDKPHVIVKVEYQLNKDASKNYEGYLTIYKFNYDGGNENKDLVVEKGKVYDIDLSKLTPEFDQITDEPYDKTVYYDLSVDVEVKDWVKVEVTPEL